MDTDSIIIYIEIEDIYSEIIKDIKKRFDTSSYDLHRPSPKRKNVIGLMKDELGIKIMTEYLGLRAKTHSYLTYINDENKKTPKSTKNASQKENLNLNIIKTV